MQVAGYNLLHRNRPTSQSLKKRSLSLRNAVESCSVRNEALSRDDLYNDEGTLRRVLIEERIDSSRLSRQERSAGC